MNHRLALLALMAAATVGAWTVGVHEGHAEAPGSGSAASSTRHVFTTLSDRYELILKNDPLRPAMKTALDLYLSDFQTNAPVAGATITLSLRSGSRELWNGTAAATQRPGIYTVPFQAPPDTGTFNMLVSIRSAAGEDRFALAGFQVTSGVQTTTASARSGTRWPWLIAVAVIVLLMLFALARRRVVGGSAAVILGVLLVATAQAHEGHDNAPTASGAPVGPGAQVYVAKESQFLLGVRTEPLRRQPIQRRLTVLGRVAPRGGVEVAIVAPQSGRVFFGDGRVPVIGLSVTKGDAVARLSVVDDLSLRAPLTGVITGVFVVNGQLVEAGQKLMTLLDPSVVWVHADVYEADIASVQRATRAVISSQTMPNLLLPGRRVALGVTQGEVPGAVEAWFEVPNVGGHLRVGSLVDVGIEQGGVESALVVPRSAVFEKDGRKLVFLHTAPERFTAREVTLGASLGARVAVTGDLNPGDRVVTTGGYPLLTAPVVGIGD